MLKLKKSVKKDTKKHIVLKNKKENKDKNVNISNLEDITYKEIDGKLDPKEPIYCFCNYISYGDMVKCDNLKVFNTKFIYNFSVLKNGFISIVSG